MSTGSSNYSLARNRANNHMCTKSPPVPPPVGLITPLPPGHSSQPVSHRTPQPLVCCHCCKSHRVIHRVSTTILNPGRVFYKCPNHGVIWLWFSPAFSYWFFKSLVDDLPIWFVQKRGDSCDLYFWEVANLGERNYAKYFVSQGIPIPAGWVLDK